MLDISQSMPEPLRSRYIRFATERAFLEMEGDTGLMAKVSNPDIDTIHWFDVGKWLALIDYADQVGFKANAAALRRKLAYYADAYGVTVHTEPVEAIPVEIPAVVEPAIV